VATSLRSAAASGRGDGLAVLAGIFGACSPTVLAFGAAARGSTKHRTRPRTLPAWSASHYGAVVLAVVAVRWRVRVAERIDRQIAGGSKGSSGADRKASDASRGGRVVETLVDGGAGLAGAAGLAAR